MRLAYWLAYATGGAQLLLALRYLRRMRELHHGYYGLVLGALPWWPVRLVGLVLLVDDGWQHTVQVGDVAEGRPMRPDFSPVHRFYVWLVRRIPWIS